jgi:FMN phosphatase YigB (HAD superfamily)
MIRAVLLDLDDTLIHTETNRFHRHYLTQLGVWMGERIAVEPQPFIARLLAIYERVLADPIPLRTLYERTMTALDRAGYGDLTPHFQAFYAERYPALAEAITPRLPTPPLLDFLAENDIRMVIATNPGLPIESIHHRMRAGGIKPGAYPFEFITSMQNMHFGKPLPAYYAEIALRLRLHPAHLLMVGDDIHNDIHPASLAGLHTYHVTPQPTDDDPHAGTWAAFVEYICGGGLANYEEPTPSTSALSARLRAFPSVVSGLIRPIAPEFIDICPAENEWSLRDIVYHLADYEVDQNQPKLRRIAKQENPFLSGEYDPWDKAVDYGGRPVGPALVQFAQRRAATLEWLTQQPDDVWSRPARSSIFGPTNFHEVVHFITEHDATHHEQMHECIACIAQHSS